MFSNYFFRWVHGHNLIYNTCWEDPRVDREALNLKPHDTLMMITSAGCNALDYALLSPKQIYCIDMNPRQNALLELKKAGIRRLEFDDFFALFGRGKDERFATWYRQTLRQDLSLTARDYWDSHQDYFTGSPRRSSFYYRGTSGYVAWLIGHYLKSKSLRDGVLSMFEAKSLDEQQALYHRLNIDSFFEGLFTWSSRRETTMSFLGVPRTQFLQLERHYDGGMAQFIRDSIKAVFTQLPLHDNYFWWLYLSGRYTSKRCPEYLKESNFAALKAGLVDRITPYTGSVLNFMLSSGERDITKFVLLDHMDWMSSNARDVLAQQWQALVRRASPNARLLWRSASLYADFIDPIQVRVGGELFHMGELLHYDRELARRLHKKDRVHTYGSFYVADLKAV